MGSSKVDGTLTVNKKPATFTGDGQHFNTLLWIMIMVDHVLFAKILIFCCSCKYFPSQRRFTSCHGLLFVV
nr:MAG TPA: Svf1-like N-terminal lipocalin domain [Caudoviricetes sp.]